MAFLRRLGIFGALVIVGLLAGACASLPADSTWGDISLVGETPQIMLAFGDRIVQVDPSTGLLVDLRDANGNVRVDDQGNPRTWLVQTAGTPLHFYAQPVQTDDQTLVAISYEEKLFQIDTAAARILNPDGIQLPGHVVANPLLTDDFLYVPISDGGLVALNRQDLTETWRFTGDQAKGIWAQPLLVENTLYVPAMNHSLYALDAQTGVEKWHVDLEGALASTPVFANGALYVGSFGHKVFKVTTDGTIAAQYTTNDWVWGAPAVVDNMIYVGDLGGNVYALKDSGSSLDEVWSRKVAGGAIRMTPLVSGDTIIVGSRDHNVYWLSRTSGEETFHRETKGEVLSNMVLIEPNDTVREPLVIVSTVAHEEQLAAFTLDQGVNRWVYPQ